MQRTGVAAATGAIVASLATLTCCLPAGLLAAAGLASLAAVFQLGQPWLLALSFGFLGIGFAQVIRAKRCGRPSSRVVLALLGVATAVVIVVALFPQVIAAWVADWGNWE